MNGRRGGAAIVVRNMSISCMVTLVRKVQYRKHHNGSMVRRRPDGSQFRAHPALTIEGVCWRSPVELVLDLGHAREVRERAAALLRRVLRLELFGEVVERVDRLLETRDRQEGGQVRRVGRDHDEAEHPPGGRHQATRERTRRLAATCRTTNVSKHVRESVETARF